MNETRLHFWPHCPILKLEEFIVPTLGMEVTKCRIVYDINGIQDVSYTPYTMRKVSSLQLVHAETIDYTYKSTNREELNDLFSKRRLCDEVLIVKQGLLTDTSIANIALFDGKDWLTPSYPLLEGTKRAELLEKGFIREKEIKCEELSSFSSIRLFNAMIEWGVLELSIEEIYD